LALDISQVFRFFAKEPWIDPCHDRDNLHKNIGKPGGIIPICSFTHALNFLSSIDDDAKPPSLVLTHSPTECNEILSVIVTVSPSFLG
jgi:hypothetical protein